jgi:tetratricopeptide (TPR) repeat protein
VESGQFPEALAEYDQAVQRDDKNPTLLLRRAKAIIDSGDRLSNRAAADYLAAGRQFKERGLFDDADRAYSGAIGLFRGGVESSPQLRAKVHAELAEVQENRAYQTFNDEPKRKSYFQAARDRFVDATALDDTVVTYWSGLARSHQRLGEWKEARQAFEKALKLKPGDLALTYSWAASLVQLREWDEAAKAYQAMIEHQPMVLSHRLRLAAIHLQPVPPAREPRPEQLEAARRCLDEAVRAEYSSHQSILWSHLAVVQVAAGRIEEYQATRTRMFELFRSPLGDDANNVAWAAAFAKDTPEGAARALQSAAKAVAVSPQNYSYLNTYGATLYRGNKRAEAIEKLDEATKQRARAYLQQVELAYGNALDLLFKAMAQYTPDQPEPARQTLRLAVQSIDRVRSEQRSENPELSLNRVWERLEFEVLRREAETLINRRP